MQNIELADIARHVSQQAAKTFNHKLRPAAGPISHKDVLSEILDSLKPIDFQDRAGLAANEKLSQKHIVVIAIEEVLRVAKDLNCGLCRNNDFLYTYNGAYWNLLEREQFERFLGLAAERIGVDRITARYHRFQEQLYKQFEKAAVLPKPEPDGKSVLINLQGGTFEIISSDFSLRNFRREDFLIYQLPFAYNPNAPCLKWQQFLNEVLPDESRQKVLAEFIGYIFTNLKLEKTLLLYGTGANGKSVVFDVLTALLGEENISHYSLVSLIHDYQRAMLSNKLLNYASEISTRLESDVFKKLSSGEPVEARLPYGRPFIMRRYAKLAFNCNELPRDVEHTEAFFRRFLIIPFDVTVPEHKRNPNLAKEIIAEELSGVFNWVLEGLQQLLKQNGFSDCQAARRMLDLYRKESDSVAMFLEDENYKQSNEFINLSMLYQAYKSYCLDNGYKPLGRNKFGKRLELNGVARQDRNQPVFFIAKFPRLSILKCCFKNTKKSKNSRLAKQTFSCFSTFIKNIFSQIYEKQIFARKIP